MNYKNRGEVPEKYKWDLTKWFITDEKWEEKFLEVSKEVDCLLKYKDKLFQKNNLYLAFKIINEYNNELEKLYAYASFKSDEDLSIGKYDRMYNKILNLSSKFEKNSAFFIPEIFRKDNLDINKLIESNPNLKVYKHALTEILLEKAHIKDEETEKIITSLLSDIHSHKDLASNLLNSDIDYGTIIDEDLSEQSLTTGNYSKFLMSYDRNVRKTAYDKMFDKRKQFSNTLGKNLIAYMSRKSSIAKIKNYKSSMDMFFSPEQIPTDIYDKLLSQTKKSLPLYFEYHQIFKKLINVDILYNYDLNAPIIKSDISYTVKKAQDYFYESVSILGEEYQSIVKKGFDEKWIDYMPYKGKRSGGYCIYIYGVTPNILMSFNNEFDSISTIAHEMGHAVNTYLLDENNAIEDTNYSLYVVEIPSLLNEILLANYVVEGEFSKEEKILVISSLLKTINSNFFGAVMESEFENIVYKKMDNEEALSTEDLNEIMLDLQKEYYSSSVELDEKDSYMWTSRSHYFTPWYLYKYASCLLGAVHFATKILNGEKDEVDNYLSFLKTPYNDFPDEILKKYGIILNEDKIYEEFFEYYNSLLEKLKELMK